MRAVALFTTAVTISCPIDIAKQLISCVNDNGFDNISGILNCLGSIKPDPVLRAYITGGLDTVVVCTVDSSTGELGACQDAGGNGFSFPFGIAIDTKGQHAYRANSKASTVSVCTIENTGQLSSCQITGSGFSSPTEITLVNLSNNPSAAFAYVVNQSKGITKCTIAADGALKSCQAIASDFNSPLDIAFNG